MLRFLNLKKYSCLVFLCMPNVLYAETLLYKYVINLESSQQKPSKLISLKKFGVSDKYEVYLTKIDLGKNKSFYRLRVGFFRSRKAASRIAKKFNAKYSKLWVDRLQKQDRKTLNKWLAQHKNDDLTLEPEKETSKTKAGANSKEKKSKKLMARAKNAMQEKKYRLAAGLYTRVIRLKDTDQHQQAMEFLGVAREKNGQLIHARAEYRLYLKKYNEGEDALRVRQRLLSLKTLLLKPRKKLNKGKSNHSDWQFFGSVLQFYRQDVFQTEQSRSSSETLSTNVNFLLRKRTESLNIKSQFNANHLKYINNPTRKDKENINILFVDVADINNNKSIRLGRQSQNRGGVLGKMDGAWVEYRLNPAWKLNMVAGFPVQTSISNQAQKNRPFYGISADLNKSENNWNFNIYAITQEIDSITDRMAVGGEVRYRKDKQNHFALLDYDIHFSELNTFFYVGNWRFDNNAAVILTINHRNSPILTTINATQGQVTSPTIESLLLTYTEAQLYQFAQDRTAKYNSIAVSSTLPVSKKWSFNADITVSNLSSTPGSAGVAAIEGTGDEYFYSAQFIGYNVFNADETSRFQLRLDDTRTFKRTRLTASTRFKLKNRKWRLRPKINFESRKNSNGGSSNKIGAGFKVDYKLKRSLKLELDLSYEIGKTTLPVSIKENNYYISAGFIWDF